MDLLKRQKAIQAEMRLKAGTAWENADFIFTNECGHHFDNSTIYRAFKKATFLVIIHFSSFLSVTSVKIAAKT